MKFLETIFTKFPMVVKLICIALLVVLIVCDIISLIKNGNTVVDPMSYAMILILICIEEVTGSRDKIIEEVKREKNVYLISTSNDKVRKFNPDAKAKTKTTRSKTDSKSETK